MQAGCILGIALRALSANCANSKECEVSNVTLEQEGGENLPKMALNTAGTGSVPRDQILGH